MWALAATPLGGAEPPVLVLGKPIEAPVLSDLGELVPSPIVLSDGRRSLGGWGSLRDLQLLQAMVGREAERTVSIQDAAWGAAAREITPGLWLWSGSRVTDFAAAQLQQDRPRKRILWGAATGTALVLLLLSLRPARARRREPLTRAPGGSGIVPLPSATTAQTVATGSTGIRPAGVGIPLGRYVLLDRIGEGGMAEVFTAVSFGSGGFRRTFVVKRLRPEMAANPTAVAHFIDEANLASTLVHPNIVPVFDFGEVSGAYFLAQEYVVGRDLGRLGRRMTEQNVARLSVSAALYVVHEVLRGLHHAHERRTDEGAPLELVHRDVTPENVMISERGEVKILDFGIVKAVQRVSQTDIGAVKGNVDYMSPEQARGRAVDRRSDLFSDRSGAVFRPDARSPLPRRYPVRPIDARRAGARDPRSRKESPLYRHRCPRSWVALWPSISRTASRPRTSSRRRWRPTSKVERASSPACWSCFLAMSFSSSRTVWLPPSRAGATPTWPRT